MTRYDHAASASSDQDAASAWRGLVRDAEVPAIGGLSLRFSSGYRPGPLPGATADRWGSRSTGGRWRGVVPVRISAAATVGRDGQSCTVHVQVGSVGVCLRGRVSFSSRAVAGPRVSSEVSPLVEQVRDSVVPRAERDSPSRSTAVPPDSCGDDRRSVDPGDDAPARRSCRRRLGVNRSAM